MFRLFAGILALLSIPGAALACSPLPQDLALEGARRSAANVDKSNTTLIEAIVVRAARWPATGTLRVVRSYWGGIKAGTELLVQPLPGSICGPERILRGERGLIKLSNQHALKSPLPFLGFMRKFEVDAYQKQGLLKR